MAQEIRQQLIASWIYKTIFFVIVLVLENRRIIIGIYIGFIYITFIRIRYTRKTLIPIQQQANKDIDRLWYENSRILYEKKQSLHNATETIPLLLHYKTQAIKDKQNLRNNLEQIYEEYAYICQLTNEEVIIKKETILRHKHIITKLETTENKLVKLLWYSTLWLSNLFL